MAVKSPFNFVPLADKVFFPDWANEVSQDVPFSDGIDGSFSITVTSETPIFIKDGKDSAFCRAGEDKYFIPSTSIKGEIRNILKILSFGKMNIDKNMRFAQREWGKGEWYDRLYPLKSRPKTIHGGWLYFDKEDGKYYIREAKIHRISLKQIDAYFDSVIFSNPRQILKKKFSSSSGFDLNEKVKILGKEMDPKTAAFKYELLRSEGIKLQDLQDLPFDILDKAQEKGPIHNRLEYNPNGTIVGDIIFTGQPDLAKHWDGGRNKGDGKFYEFVFEDAKLPIIEVPEDVFDQHEFIYTQSDSADWKFLKKEITNENSYGMPVFFRFADKDKRIVSDFGLSFLYKLPYSKTPKQLADERFSEDWKKGFRFDLADIIFGIVGEGYMTKGRVQFSNLFVEGNPVALPERHLTLNSPKASYYPIYINQPGGDYRTYNDGALSGWKRYVLQDDVWGSKEKKDEKLDTTIEPLSAGTVFKGRVTYHNLKPVELGAILSALTFLNTDGCYHSLGQAKSYGYGRVSIDVNDITEEDKKKYISLFVSMMTDWLKDWSTYGGIIPELIALSKSVVKVSDPRFKYMILKMEGPNEFAQEKEAKHSLLPLSKILHVNAKPEINSDTAKKEVLDSILREGQGFLAAGDYVKAIKCFKDARNVSDVDEVKVLLEKAEGERRNELVNKGKALMKENNFSSAKMKFDSAQSIKYSEDIQNLIIVCISKGMESVSSSAPVTFESCLESTGFGQLNGKTSKYVKTVSRLNEEQRALYKNKIFDIYTNSSKQQKKDFLKWNKNWKEVAANVDNEELAKSWFEEIAGNKA